ncbi:hypothetical protein SBRCBS47491_001717 [Sporothrix bragantina]|uniref:SGNH hydrolase-type esterase domain-containing protein n=1 Tax=Sporothrix bragantina TaxID=671064 RepID=A0ABP0B104_9PEZI
MSLPTTSRFVSTATWASASAVAKRAKAPPIPSLVRPNASRRFMAQIAKPPLRLMPLGGSVTYGSESSNGNGYRKALRDKLFNGGYQVEMVGSRKAGSMENNANEGWRGYRIDQIHNRATKSVPRLRPNLFTINAGSNDCLQDFELGLIEKRMSDLLEYLWSASPRATVILSTLVVNEEASAELRVQRVNEHLRRLAQQRITEKKRIVLAEMHGTDGPQVSDLADGTHPGDAGYEKMAEIWYSSIEEAAAHGFLQHPEPLD